MDVRIVIFLLSITLLIPINANAQYSDRITLLNDFSVYDKGEQFFVYGKLGSIMPDSFLIMQIVNPRGDLCQIQQLTPLSNGIFLTQAIPLEGRICGISGDYEIKIFYGPYSTKAEFQVTSDNYEEKTGADYFDSAIGVVSQKIEYVNQKTDIDTSTYSASLHTLKSQSSDNTIGSLEELYVSLWSDFVIDDEIYEIDEKIRPVISDTLSTTTQLIERGKLSLELAEEIDKTAYAALFYYEIGDQITSIDRLNDVYVNVTNADPVKVDIKRSPSFSQIEETLLNLMGKSQSVMNRDVKEEVAFIFSRGTGPLYVDELNNLVDLLSKSRYLDMISRNSDPLYKLTQSEWESTKSSLMGKASIEELLESKDKVDKLHSAALLLRSLDNVDRFITTDRDENSELANLIKSDWDDLSSSLELATSIDEILESEEEITDMKNVIDISSRVAKVIEISQESNVNHEFLPSWKMLLEQIDEADSIPEMLQLVSEFDQSMTELREKRNPISILKFEYNAMKEKAELQGDNKNLFYINNALKILHTAEDMEKGNPYGTKIDRIGVLLTWVSEKAPVINQELESYSKDTYKVRASEILQKAKSVENLVDMGLRNHKFLPGYTNFTYSMKDKITDVRELVIQEDLATADNLVRGLFSDWQEVSKAYATDPYGSDVGYDVDEIKRIEYRKVLNSISSTASTFYNTDFAPHSTEFVKLSDEASELIDYGNFIDAESKIKEMNQFLNENLILANEKIFYDISFDAEKDRWVISGAVYKPNNDRREDLNLTVYSSDGSIHSTLEFSNTRNGEFYTQWESPTEPGLYIVMLEYLNTKASQIVNINEKVERVYSTDEIDILELAREYEELEAFVEEFGGANYEQHHDKFERVLDQIKRGLVDRNPTVVSKGNSDLDQLIDRYLPMRSRNGVIEASYSDDQLHVAGSVVIGYINFREDIFIDIFDQKGELIDTIAFKTSPSGNAGKFDKVLSKSYPSGTYVAQLQYYDLFVTDFFTVTR